MGSLEGPHISAAQKRAGHLFWQPLKVIVVNQCEQSHCAESSHGHTALVQPVTDLLPTELHGQVVSEVGTAFTRKWPMESSLEKMEAARKIIES